MIQFAWPWVFFLLPLPLLARALLAPTDSHRAALKVPFYADLKQAGQHGRTGGSRLRWLLLSAIWLCLVAAAARPQQLGELVDIPVSGRDLMLAVDISASMRAGDMLHNRQLQTRLDAVKRVAGDFIQRRTGDRIGLILFGTRAYLQSPLSQDRKTVKQFLDEAEIGIAGEKTAIGDAIGLTIKRLEKSAGRDKVLLLLTDGSNTAGATAPDKAAQLAAATGLKIHAIGIGSAHQAGSGLLSLRRGSPVGDLDEALLKRIAANSGGAYFRATDADALEEIYRLIDQLEPIERSNYLRPNREVFFWPLGAALLLFLGAAGVMLVRALLPVSAADETTPSIRAV